MYEAKVTSLLDDVAWIHRIDRDGMRTHLEAFPTFCEDAVECGKGLDLPSCVTLAGGRVIRYARPTTIIVAGVGGSAIGGSLLQDWLRDALPLPIEVPRSGHLPAYAGKDTLVFAVSYSGNTAETVRCFVEALERGCMVVALTSGGILRDYCHGLGVPLVQLPRGYPPRTALPYLFLPLAVVLGQLGALPCRDAEVEEAIAVLQAVGAEVLPATPVSRNPAKRVALALKDHIPLILGAGFYGSVALRLKTQFNENSKTPATMDLFPEFTHNMIEGWLEQRDLTGTFAVLLLRDRQEPPAIRAQIETTRRLVLQEGAARIQEIWSRGRGRLARMLSALYLGDWASFYLALLYGVNPTPTPCIDEVKRRLTTGDARQALHTRYEALTFGRSTT